jgi:hypothetical protein
MADTRLRVRANRSTGELEVEGSPTTVQEWWDKLWPELIAGSIPPQHLTKTQQRVVATGNDGGIPDVFGEFYTQFRSDITDVNRMLIAGAFVQGRDPDRIFTTKNANQLLMDQNVKLANPSECVRRLIQTKRAFVVSEGRFRVSASGFEHLNSLKSSS